MLGCQNSEPHIRYCGLWTCPLRWCNVIVHITCNMCFAINWPTWTILILHDSRNIKPKKLWGHYLGFLGPL